MGDKKVLFPGDHVTDVLSGLSDDETNHSTGVTRMKYLDILHKILSKPLHIDDLRSLDVIFQESHTNPGKFSFLDPETLEKYANIIMKQVIKNEYIINSFDTRTYGESRDDKYEKTAIYDEYVAICLEQLLLLTKGALSFLDHRFVPIYLGYVARITESEEGKELLYDFLDMNAFSYISPRDTKEGSMNTTAVLMNHMKFLATHHMDMGETETEDISKIITQCDIDDNNAFQGELDSILHVFRRTLESFPPHIQRSFAQIKNRIISEKGEFYFRKLAQSVVLGKMVDMDLSDSVDSFLATFSFACIYSQDSLIKKLIDFIPVMGLDENQLLYIGTLLQEREYFQESSTILISYCDLQNPDTLKIIARVGIMCPELVGRIQTEFAHKLDDMGLNACMFFDFTSELEEQVVLGTRDDISLQKVTQLSGLAYWMQAKFCERSANGKEGDYMNRSREHYGEALEKLQISSIISKNEHSAIIDPEMQQQKQESSEEYQEILADYGYFLARHTTQKDEAFLIFEFLHSSFKNRTHILILVELALETGNREKAYSFLLYADRIQVTGTQGLWLTFHMASDSIDSKIQAARILSEMSMDELVLADKDTVESVKNFVATFCSLQANHPERTSEDEKNYLAVLRLYAVGFSNNIDYAIRYWRQFVHLSKDIEQMGIIEQFYSSFTDPEIYSEAYLGKTTENILLNKTLLCIDADARKFYYSFSDEEKIDELLQIILSVFRDFPEGKGLGLAHEWEKKYHNLVSFREKKMYGIGYVPQTSRTLQ